MPTRKRAGTKPLLAIPPESEEFSSSRSSEPRETIAPGIRGVPEISKSPDTGTSFATPLDETKGLTAPVRIPSQEELQVPLVRADLVYKLDENRSDQARFENFFFTLVGAVIGILSQSNPFAISAWSVAVIILLGIFTCLTWLHLRTLGSRVKKVSTTLSIQP